MHWVHRTGRETNAVRLATIIALALLLAGCGQQERSNDALERQWLEQQLERQAAADAEDERIRAERRKSIESARRYLEENPMCTGCIGLDGKPMGMPPE